MHTATLTDIRPATRDGAFLLHVRCDRCERDCLHGGGFRLDGLPDFLGHREGHCKCPGGYVIIDPDGVIPHRQAEIRADEAARPARRSVR